MSLTRILKRPAIFEDPANLLQHSNCRPRFVEQRPTVATTSTYLEKFNRPQLLPEIVAINQEIRALYLKPPRSSERDTTQRRLARGRLSPCPCVLIFFFSSRQTRARGTNRGKILHKGPAVRCIQVTWTPPLRKPVSLIQSLIRAQ